MCDNGAIVIFSGGQDSTTCLYWATRRFKKVAALTFDYHQKHLCEIDQSRIICEKEGIPQKIISLDFMSELVRSDLINQAEAKEDSRSDSELPGTFVPMRNQLFLTLAYAWGTSIEHYDIVIGVCETDYSGYYDCRDDFIKGFQAFTNLAYHLNFKIHTPLMDLTKSETFLLAEELGCLESVVELSHSCYRGDRSQRHPWGYGCGVCLACRLRETGWNQYSTLKEKKNEE